MLDNLFSLGNLKRNEAAEKISNNFENRFDEIKELSSNEGVEKNKIKKTVKKLFLSLIDNNKEKD